MSGSDASPANTPRGSARELEERAKAVQDKAVGSGLLDEQFSQLQMLQDESNPDFMEEVVSLYLDDSAVKLDKLSSALAESSPSCTELDGVVHQLKGSSASIGAPRVTAACVAFREAAQAENVEGMRQSLSTMKSEFTQVRSTLSELLTLEQHMKAASG